MAQHPVGHSGRREGLTPANFNHQIPHHMRAPLNGTFDMNSIPPGVPPPNFYQQHGGPQGFYSRQQSSIPPMPWRVPLYENVGRPQNQNHPPPIFPNTRPDLYYNHMKNTPKISSAVNASSAQRIPDMERIESSMPLHLPTPALDHTDGSYQTELFANFSTISAIMKFRAENDSKNLHAFTFTDARFKHIENVNFEMLHIKAVLYASYLREKMGCLPGTSVALLFRQNEYSDFVGALFGCFYSGLIAVPIVTHSFNSNDEFLEIFFMLTHSKSNFAIVGDASFKFLSRNISKKLASNNSPIHWIKTSEVNSYKRTEELNMDFELIIRDVAYLEYTKSTSGDLKGIAISHKVILNQCRLLKDQQAFSNREVLLTCMEPRQGFGLLFGIFFGIFSGFHTIYAPNDICSIPGLWLLVATRFKATICLAESSDVLSVIASLGKYVPGRKDNVDLCSVKSLLIESISPNPDFSNDIADALSNFGLLGAHVIVPILSMHELGGVLVSIPQGFLGQKTFKKSKSLLLDSKSVADRKVSVLSVTDDVNTLSMDDSPGVIRITDSGKLNSEGNIIFFERQQYQ